MVTWKSYLALLAEDGVSLDEIEDDEIDNRTGERIMVYMLTREVNGKILKHVLLQNPVRTEPVRKHVQRQAANELNLPYEKYIKNPL